MQPGSAGWFIWTLKMEDAAAFGAWNPATHRCLSALRCHKRIRNHCKGLLSLYVLQQVCASAVVRLAVRRVTWLTQIYHRRQQRPIPCSRNLCDGRP